MRGKEKLSSLSLQRAGAVFPPLRDLCEVFPLFPGLFNTDCFFCPLEPGFVLVL